MDVKNKYKDLFGDKGTKNNYINPGIKKDLIVTNIAQSKRNQ